MNIHTHLADYQLPAQDDEDQQIQAYLKQIQQIRNRVKTYQNCIQQERSKKVLLDQLLRQQSFSSPSHTEQQDRSSISSGFIHQQFSHIKEYMSKKIVNQKKVMDQENAQENQRYKKDRRYQKYQEQENIKNLVKATMLNTTLTYKPTYIQRGNIKQEKRTKQYEQQSKKKELYQIDKTLSNWKRPKIFANVSVRAQSKYTQGNLAYERSKIRQQLINERQIVQNNQKQKDFYQIKYKNLYQKYEQFEKLTLCNRRTQNFNSTNLNKSGQQSQIMDTQQKKHQFCTGLYKNQRRIYNNLLKTTKREKKKCGALIQNIRNLQFYEKIRMLELSR